MIGNIVTDSDGNPIDSNGNKLSPSSYQPSDEVKKLFARVQADYQTAYMLQHRGFREFDGHSLLTRARLDQELFAAYVGCEWVPQHKRWRWKGRKNTSRNKLIGLMAHMLAGMLFPYVYAYNDENEEDKMAARVMRILVEDHLKKADYEIKFLFMVCSALVNPATIISVEYITSMQRIKQKLADGTYKVVEAVDELLSGINLNNIPIDELLVTDFYSGTGQLQKLPCLIRVRRISYDQSRSEFAGKYFENGKDRFDYVQAGMTRVVLSSQENQTLFDIEWTEADANFVQVITFMYRPEDLEVTWVGGVFMGEEKDIYNSNPFKHRRMTMVGKEYITMPVYNYAMSGFEPLDPSGRFLYYKSGAFKEYWDDQGLNKMHQLVFDGTYLDVIKPTFIQGITKVDSRVIAPGATVGVPVGATVTPYSVGPNLTAAYNSIRESEKDLSESTQDKLMGGSAQPGVTAYATRKAEQNARIFFGIFGIHLADIVRKIGELTTDCIIQHTTVGEIDATIPEALKMNFRKMVSKGKEGGRDVTNHVMFTDKNMGRELSQKEYQEKEWALFDKAGGLDTDQRIYEVNPYKFARLRFSLAVDADQIVMRSTGAYEQKKALAFQMLSDPRVLPYTDPEAVVNDFIIEPFSDGDPSKYKRKPNTMDLPNAIMGNSQGTGIPGAPGQIPSEVVPKLPALTQ